MSIEEYDNENQYKTLPNMKYRKRKNNLKGRTKQEFEREKTTNWKECSTWL